MRCDGGSHHVLQWLVRCAQLRRFPRSASIPSCVHLRDTLADVVENINCAVVPMSCTDLDALETQVAVWVMKTEFPMHVITYLSWFFHRYRVFCRVHSFPDLPCTPMSIDWLTVQSMERALVIPDVRKLAFQLFQRAELRSGELEWGSALGTLSVTSVDNVLQIFRTSEYMGRARGTLTYGNSGRMSEQGLIPYIVMAMVDIRLRSRAQLPWVDKCVLFMHTLGGALPPWPVVLVAGRRFYCVYKERSVCSACMFETIRAWFDVCVHQMTTELDGRWNISSLTI